MKKKPNGYWTRETILEEAKKHKTLYEFTTKANGAYNAAWKLGILDDVKKILTFHFQPNGYWTYERCLLESKKYKTLIEFHDGSKGAYVAAVKNGWIGNFNLISTRNKNYGKTYTLDELNELTKKCYNKTEFRKTYYHAYNFAKKSGILNDLSYIGKIAKGIEQKNETKETTKAKRVKKETPKRTCVRRPKYSYKELYDIARKYKTLKDFRKNEPSPYTIACQKKWLNDYIWLGRERHFYNEEECYNTAKSCKNITEFHDKSIGAYTFALKHDLLKQYGWFNKIKSTLEQEIEDLLLLNDIDYVKQKKFPWLKYKNPQSLDFYLPNYKIAIECQGIQHFRRVKYFNQTRRTPTNILDENKKKLCEEHGIELLYFSNLGIEYPYKVYEDKEKILEAIKN